MCELATVFHIIRKWHVRVYYSYITLGFSLLTWHLFMSGHFYKTLKETLIHSGIFIYLGDSGCQIRVDGSSLYRKKRNKEVGDKRSRANILTIRTDLNLRVERRDSIYYPTPTTVPPENNRKIGRWPVWGMSYHGT